MTIRRIRDPSSTRLTRWVWTAAIAASSMSGLASIAIADAARRHGRSYDFASSLFWLGLFLIFVPIAFRVLMARADRRERLVLLVWLGVAFYVVKILASPSAFTFVDEYIHVRGTQDILRTRHLFTFNPLLPTAAYYPGLAAFTAAVVDLTGLSPFASGLIIIGLARVLMSAGVFLVAERVTRSSRAAAAAGLVYAANPMFLFWSAAFSYEDLALPLAVVVVWWIGTTRSDPGRFVPLVTVLGIVAVTITHHAAGFALAGLLGCWWFADRVVERHNAGRQSIGLMAVLAIAVTLAWFLLVARPAPRYLLTQNIVPALQQTGSLLLGHIAPRRLYASGGYVSPGWEPFAGIAAVTLLCVMLAAAIRLIWRKFRGGSLRGAGIVVAAAVSIAFPLSLLPRFSSVGVAISGRSSEYIFAVMGCVLGLVIAERLGARRKLGRRDQGPPSGWLRGLIATSVMTVVLVGNVTIGTAFYQRLPEPPHPRGYPWMVQPDVMQASRWVRRHLGPNQRFGASAIDRLALATVGQQNTLQENSVWPIFYARALDAATVQQIRTARLRYVLVDWRLTTGSPPNPGYYFSPQEPRAGEYRRRFPIAGLAKFATACTRLIYEADEVQIFDLEPLLSRACAAGDRNQASGAGNRLPAPHASRTEQQ